MSKRTGPTVRGTKKDGSPRVYAGRLPKTEVVPVTESFLSVVGPAHVSVRSASAFSLYSYGEVGEDVLRAVDVHMDYWDAANEDAHGRLPHQAGYGSPLHVVPEPPAIPLVEVDLGRAA